MKPLTFLTSITFAIVHVEGNAHHGSSIYDRESEVSIEGTIVQYEWVNPHVYIWVEEELESGQRVTWEIEGAPPAMLRRYGWTEDLINVGDRVAVNGNPGRNADRRIALMDSLEETDGTEIMPGQAKLIASPVERDETYTEKATSLAGTWATVPNLEVIGRFLSPSTLDVTEKGRAAIDNFVEAADSPSLECTADAPPAAMLAPDIKMIEVRDDVVLLRREWDAVERTVYMSIDSHDGAVESIQGHSIGRWEGDTLVIDTTHFSPHRSGITSGLPSGPKKHLVERLQLSDDGLYLTYSFELEDPEYLVEPITAAAIQWSHRPDLSYMALPCDVENARRFAE